jgi:hypothetical protein
MHFTNKISPSVSAAANSGDCIAKWARSIANKRTQQVAACSKQFIADMNKGIAQQKKVT